MNAAPLWNVFDDEPTDECVEEADCDDVDDDERTWIHFLKEQQ